MTRKIVSGEENMLALVDVVALVSGAKESKLSKTRGGSPIQWAEKSKKIPQLLRTVSTTIQLSLPPHLFAETRSRSCNPILLEPPLPNNTLFPLPTQPLCNVHSFCSKATHYS